MKLMPAINPTQSQASERSIFLLPNIQLFPRLFLMEYIQCTCPDKLEEYTQFSIQLHNNQ